MAAGVNEIGSSVFCDLHYYFVNYVRSNIRNLKSQYPYVLFNKEIPLGCVSVQFLEPKGEREEIIKIHTEPYGKIK